MSPLELRATAESTPPRYPGFAIPAKPPREGFPTGTRRNLSYAARAKLSLAVKTFPSVLPGTRGPGHAATASLTPSKPVAPLGGMERYRVEAMRSTRLQPRKPLEQAPSKSARINHL